MRWPPYPLRREIKNALSPKLLTPDPANPCVMREGDGKERHPSNPPQPTKTKKGNSPPALLPFFPSGASTPAIFALSDPDSR